MGQLFSAPMPALIARLEDCLLPDDREQLLNTMEAIQSKVGSVIGKSTATQQFASFGGVPVLLKAMKTMVKDDVVMRLGVAIFDYQRENKPAMVEFIRNGGMVVLDDCLKIHKLDSTLELMIPVLQRYVRAAGAGAAIKEINDEAVSLQLCEHCQLTIDRMKKNEAGNSGNKAAPVEHLSSLDRAVRVLMFMKNYPSRKPVVVAGLSALMYYSVNANKEKSIQESVLCVMLHEIAENFVADPDVIWRVAVICRNISNVGENIAFDILKTDIHEVLHDAFNNCTEHRVRQQILWYFECVLKYSKCRNTLQMSEKIMTLIGKLCEDRKKLGIKQKLYPPKDKFEMYKVIIPFFLKQFYNETGGVILKLDTVEPEAPYIKPRKQFEKLPMYGTVDTKIFNSDKDNPVGNKYKLVDKDDEEKRGWK